MNGLIVSMVMVGGSALTTGPADLTRSRDAPQTIELQMSSGLDPIFPRLASVLSPLASPSVEIMWCLMLCKEKIMRSSLFKPLIMPGWPRHVVPTLSSRIKKIENKRIGAGSSKY